MYEVKEEKTIVDGTLFYNSLIDECMMAWFAIFLLLPFFGWLWPKFKLWRWKQRLHLKQHLSFLDALSAPYNGFQLSKLARQRGDAFEYVYGEIDNMSFVALLSLIRPHTDTIFYDLGSGTGKTVLLCAMVFPIKKACGIELFPELHQAAEQQRQKLEASPNYKCVAKKIDFLQGNFLECYFSDATVIFISATALFGDTWLQLNKRLENLSDNPIIITTSKRLLSPKFQLKHHTRVQMSWGVVDAYIQQKTDFLSP
ncbi:MAG TPA: hypothetical protein VHD33_00865 [Legionellaceae bacterium]|nr:hypothetical protein [Legionellaceae bacterium]